MDKSIVKISTDDIREYIGYLFDGRNLKDSSVQTHINVLRSFFCWLNTEGIIRKNPMAKIKSLRVDKKGARHALTTEDLNDCYKDYPQIIKDNLLNGWTRADLQDKPASQGKTVTLVQMAELLKAAGVTTIQI